MGPIWDAELQVWGAKNFGPASPRTHRNKFVKKSLNLVLLPLNAWVNCEVIQKLAHEVNILALISNKPKEAQWLSGRVLDPRSRGCLIGDTVVSLSKACLVLVHPRKTRPKITGKMLTGT